MTKPGTEQEKGAAEHPAHDPARPVSMSDMPYFSEALSLNPLLANPAAAMAAATAIGFGFANQMASAFFGVMQGALETANRQKAAQEADVAPVKDVPVAAEPAKASEAVTEKVEVVKTPKAKAQAKPSAKKAAVKAEAPAQAAPAAKPAKAKAAPKAVVKAEPEAVIKAPAKTKAPGKTKAPAKATGKAAAGDLKKISGIGPKLEGLLNGMGVTNVAQIAAWTDKDIARFDKELGFEGRIVRDDWVGQAKALLK